MKPCVASHHLDTCSWEVWRKSIQGKWQKWCVVHVTKKQCVCNSFFALSPKPIARFCWKRARLRLFRPQPHLPNFIQIHPSFRDLLAKTTFQIVTIPIGSPITSHAITCSRAHSSAVVVTTELVQKISITFTLQI